jgi:hypothetical protein
MAGPAGKENSRHVNGLDGYIAAEGEIAAESCSRKGKTVWEG